MDQSTTPSLSLTIWPRWASRQFLYCPDLALWDFWLFPKLRGCRYETIEEMKEAVTKVIDTLTQEDFQKLLERYDKCIATVGDYFEGDYSFMCVLSIKVPVRKNPGNLYNDPRIKHLFFSEYHSPRQYYKHWLFYLALFIQLHIILWLQMLLYITNNSIQHQLFVYTLLNGESVVSNYSI